MENDYFKLLVDLYGNIKSIYDKKNDCEVLDGARRATYEIQFGSIERPTHWNTSYDKSKFEVCGHKWADLSEGAYGVSLLNDGKYGHQAYGNTLGVTLVRASYEPDTNPDEGLHR
ncbi:MAG: glycoside hydrolase family 38 C-terminal domain-containing protein, partial [Clostridiales bacterium]|nr:glycoside hydrolase family 38 C-terminal domain-containing protein [Clostridiales bacterium]